MYLELSEAEAHVLILKGLGMHDDTTLRKRGSLHLLQSPHKIVIHLPGEEPSIFRPDPIEEFIEGGGLASEEPPDDCFVVDGINDDIAEIEEHLDGT